MSALRQKLKGWRTVLFGGLVAAAGVVLDLLEALQAVDITPLLPPVYALRVIAALGLATVLLRLVTTGRVGRKGD
jgi:hypothetical protein